MRISYRWLKELLDIPPDHGAREVADKLTLVGLEVEAVEDLGAALKDLVVGLVVTREKHPGSDHLSVCQVDVGAEAKLSIVCGAPNCDEGKLVAVARVGTTVKGLGQPLEAREVRGVRSEGMLCSAKELGLPGGDHTGILHVEGTHVPGTPLAKALGLDDAVLEVAVTPNRPDALSHVGVARDLAAAFSVGGSSPPSAVGPHPTPHHGAPGAEPPPPADGVRRLANASSPPIRVKMPPATCAERGGPIDDAAQVRVEDPVRCPRYLARVIEGVTVGPSPLWVQRRLEACGLRAINNIVDATNLVLLERGHPLHAFDLDRLGLDRGRPTVVVRTAKPNEKLVTLDGVERQLHAEDLLICDPERPIGLAGVMGGRDSEVSPTTVKVLLEAAYFQPVSIRRTARRHNLHTEASHRFERGCDPNKTLEESLNRCAQLIAEMGGGQVRRGIAASYPKVVEPVEIKLRPARVTSLLGLPPKTIDEAMVARTLTALGFEVSGRETGAIRFRVPTFRPDVTEEVDLIEEIGRVVGLDRVPEAWPRGTGRVPPYRPRDPRLVVQDRLRTVLCAAGFDEAVNLGFVSPREAEPFDGNGQRIPRVVLRNPLSEEVSVLRGSLLPGLLRNIQHNQRHGELEVRLFETATVFLGLRPEGLAPRPTTEDGPTGGDAYAKEGTHLALVMTGTRDPRAHDVKAVPLDFHDLRGVLEEAMEALGFRGTPFAPAYRVVPAAPASAPFLHPGIAAVLKVGEQDVGLLGALHPALVEKLELKGSVLAAEVDVALLAELGRSRPVFRPIPRLPGIRRDVAALVDEALPIEQVFAAVRDTTPAREGLVERVDLFDLYRGPSLPPGKKSVGLSLTFRAPDRTLTDDAVNALHADVMRALEHGLRAEVRKG
jgi:phenylalanyl-tRNA synthetase beta chain